MKHGKGTHSSKRRAPDVTDNGVGNIAAPVSTQPGTIRQVDVLVRREEILVKSAKLFEDGTIEYHFANMVSGNTSSWADGNSATVGIESVDAGIEATLVISINTPNIRPNTAYRFVRQ